MDVPARTPPPPPGRPARALVRSLVAACLRRPARTLAAALLAAGALGAGVRDLSTEVGYRAFLGADHPAVRRLDRFAARFGGGLPFAAVYRCDAPAPCQSVFDPVALRMAAAVAEGLASTPGVAGVDGPATSPVLVQPLFGLPRARTLVEDGGPVEDRASLAARALADPTWVGQIVSADGRAGALVVHLTDSEPETGVAALAALRRLLAPWEARGFEFALVGGPVEFVVAGAELDRSTAVLVPAMVALVGLLLASCFGALAPALAALGAVGAAALATSGLQGWLGWPRNSLLAVLPPLVLVIGVCDAIHLLSRYAAHLPTRRAGRAEREAAVLEAAGVLGPPCAMTSLTTAAGFLSFAAAPLASLRHFGVLAAFGVMAALVVTFTVLPVVVVRLPAHRASSTRLDRWWASGLERLAGWSRRRALAVLAATALVAGAGSFGFARLEVESSFEDLYGARSQVVRWVHAARAALREPETLEVVLDLPPGTAPSDPEALRVLARVESLAELPGIDRPLSILVPMRALHELVHGAPLPLEGERPAQMLRLLQRAAPEEVALFVDREPPGLRVSFQAEKLAQRDLFPLLETVDARLAALPPGFRAESGGPLATVAILIREIRASQLQSFATAALLVYALIALFLRSLRLAGLALVPTLVPVVATLGAMGLLGIPLDVGSAMVAAVVLGLAVDNAIHLLAAMRLRRGAGEPAPAAMAGAVRDAGRALATSSLALAVGFGALSLAPWGSIARFGAVTAVALAVALLAALVVLPAWVQAASRRAGA